MGALVVNNYFSPGTHICVVSHAVTCMSGEFSNLRDSKNQFDLALCTVGPPALTSHAGWRDRLGLQEVYVMLAAAGLGHCRCRCGIRYHKRGNDSGMDRPWCNEAKFVVMEMEQKGLRRLVAGQHGGTRMMRGQDTCISGHSRRRVRSGLSTALIDDAAGLRSGYYLSPDAPTPANDYVCASAGVRAKRRRTTTSPYTSILVVT